MASGLATGHRDGFEVALDSAAQHDGWVDVGLVLAGGRSTRMRRDKATLAYQGQNALDRAMELLDPCVAQAFVSVRPDQRTDPARARYAQVVDAQEGRGPIAGIAAAQQLAPDAAWLVLACDLPWLE